MKIFYLPLLLLSIIFLYLVLSGGFTWQLVPLIGALALSFLIVLILKRWSKWAYILVFLGCFATSASLFIFPTITLPSPSGKYTIGVQYATVTTQRKEIFTIDSLDTRTLYCKIWYPSQSISSINNPYLDGGITSIQKLAKLADLPSFLFSHFAAIQTHSFSNIPIANGKFPLITFSHGYGSWFGQNTILMEELASLGFIVIALTHSHQSIMAAKNEYDLVEFEKIVPLESEEDSKRENNTFDELLTTQDTNTFTYLFYKQLSETSPFIHECLGVWAEDIRSVLDYMIKENYNKESTFFAHLDTSKIGSIGMSFGGAAVGEAALRDKRIKAGINMDGTQYGNWPKDTINIPMLMMEAKRSRFGYSIYAPLKKRSTSPYISVIFLEAEHYNFTDVSIYSPVFRWLGVTGSIKGQTMLRQINYIVSDFFSRTLIGEYPDITDYLIEGITEKPTF